MMADHTLEQLDAFADILAKARTRSQNECLRLSELPLGLRFDDRPIPPAAAVADFAAE